MLAASPFVDRPIGDEASARPLAEALAGRLGLGEPVLLRAAMNATYIAGDVVIRVGRTTVPGHVAYDLAEVLLSAGISVPAPAAGHPVEHDGDLTATAWQRIPTGDGGADWRTVGEMVARLHALDPAAVGGYPVPPAMSFPWWHFDAMLLRVEPFVDAADLDVLAAAAARVAGWEDSVAREAWVLCHGDVHPHNVVAGPDGPVIVDWDLLCIAPAAWDHAPLRSMVERWGGDPAWYADFAAGAALAGDDEPLVERLVEGRLLAATLMRVIAEGADRSADSEASRRLRWWRRDPDAPYWSVV
jgi:hypothetical protein